MTKRERLDSIATNGDLFPELTDEQKKENDYIVSLMATIHRLCRRNRKTETTIGGERLWNGLA